MKLLPAGKKSLKTIARDRDAAGQVIDLVILLDYLLSTLEGEAMTTRERVDLHASKMSRMKDVHFGITIRNRLSHSDPGERHPSDEEVERARDHLFRGVRDVLPHLDPKLARAAEGTEPMWRRFLPALWFLGVWQVFAVSVRIGLGDSLDFAFAREATLVAGCALLHLAVFPFLSRLVPRLDVLFRVMLYSYALALVPIGLGIAAYFSAPDESGIITAYTHWLGAVDSVLTRILGEGARGFAPWLVLGDVSFWDQVRDANAVTVMVFGAVVVFATQAKVFAHLPLKWIQRVSAGKTVQGRWADAIPLAAGAALVVERLVSLFL